MNEFFILNFLKNTLVRTGLAEGPITLFHWEGDANRKKMKLMSLGIDIWLCFFYLIPKSLYFIKLFGSFAKIEYIVSVWEEGEHSEKFLLSPILQVICILIQRQAPFTYLIQRYSPLCLEERATSLEMIWLWRRNPRILMHK